MSRVIDVGPAEFATVRAVLKLSQGQFAERLGLSRRTVIRGEQRGIELPPNYYFYWHEKDKPDGLRARWAAAVKEAEASKVQYIAAAESDTIAKILAKVSQDQTDYMGRRFAEAFREKVEGMRGDLRDRLARAKVSRVTKRAGATAKAVRGKQKGKLARRKK